jgi:hypothetical protein
VLVAALVDAEHHIGLSKEKEIYEEKGKRKRKTKNAGRKERG